jgi:hypothetical protein
MRLASTDLYDNQFDHLIINFPIINFTNFVMLFQAVMKFLSRHI